MNTSVAVTFAFIVLARITDMTMDTIRTAAIVQGRRAFAASLGFFQALIYILVNLLVDLAYAWLDPQIRYA